MKTQTIITHLIALLIGFSICFFIWKQSDKVKDEKVLSLITVRDSLGTLIDCKNDSIVQLKKLADDQNQVILFQGEHTNEIHKIYVTKIAALTALPIDEQVGYLAKWLSEDSSN